MLTSQNIEITNNKNNIFNNETYVLVKKMIPPNINEETINLFNKILSNIKLKSVKKKQKLNSELIKTKNNLLNCGRYRQKQAPLHLLAIQLHQNDLLDLQVLEHCNHSEINKHHILFELFITKQFENKSLNSCLG